MHARWEYFSFLKLLWCWCMLSKNIIFLQFTIFHLSLKFLIPQPRADWWKRLETCTYIAASSVWWLKTRRGTRLRKRSGGQKRKMGKKEMEKYWLFFLTSFPSPPVQMQVPFKLKYPLKLKFNQPNLGWIPIHLKELHSRGWQYEGASPPLSIRTTVSTQGEIPIQYFKQIFQIEIQSNISNKYFD